MPEINDFEKQVQFIINQSNGVIDEKPNTENYLQKHLLEIQDELENEIVDRQNLEQFLKLIWCQCTNYTLSLFLISLGMEIWTTTLIGLFISLVPGVKVLWLVARTKEDSPFKYLPVAVNVGVGLFTSTVIFTSVTVPHLVSQNTVKKVYQKIEVVNSGQHQNNALTNPQNSPLTSIVIALLILTAYLNFRKK